ncbi:MAG: polysaccharide deacetylase family protein [Solirubrobacterales bacterium]|nr:polysaccharide deacetylase family protein [Solirubrobacterales bacterium]
MASSDRDPEPDRRLRQRRASRERRRRAVRAQRAGAVLLAVAVAAVAVAVAVLLVSAGSSHGGGRARAAGVRISPRAPATAKRAARRRAAARAAALQNAGQTPPLRRLIAMGRPIYCAGRRGREVALTFDDGPGPYTRLVVRKLREHHMAATFFIVGRNIPLVPGVTRAERALGDVGDHTFTHPLLTALAPSEAEAEIVHTKHALEAASRGPVILFRPPYGGFNPTIDRIARQHGLAEILWTVDSADSLGANYAGIEHNVITGLHPGAIILMHENRGQTVRALPAIFAAIRRRGLRPVSVPRLLTDDPPSARQLREGGAGCGVSHSVGSGG